MEVFEKEKTRETKMPTLNGSRESMNAARRKFWSTISSEDLPEEAKGSIGIIDDYKQEPGLLSPMGSIQSPTHEELVNNSILEIDYIDKTIPKTNNRNRNNSQQRYASSG